MKTRRNGNKDSLILNVGTRCLVWYISNKMQRYTVYFFLETALHVSGGISTHHQELSIFQYISNKTQRYTVYLFLETALHVSGGISTHHQEHIQVAVTVWQVPDAVDTVVFTPDDGWRYHPKHVEQFTDINKLCNVAFCWIYFGIYLAPDDGWR